MEIETIRTYCLQQPGVTEGLKWGDHLTFMVGEKMFAIFGFDQTPINASFKVSDDDFEEMQDRPGMKAAPYLARYKWIAVEDISMIPEKEWYGILDQSYELIKMKLPKKTLKSIDDPV
ncbi:MmcQ/YjbR family DNA-binding protein [Ekhidna sp.]|uniref:MmcQ/YjbR family DNA-binding protein n=1 Tax=Ekhidna sp. TaxID=2608089 RepID=UPI003BAC1FF4